MRRGYSVIELVLVVAIVAILAGTALPRLGALRDRGAVRAAAAELVAMLSSARQTALLRSAPVALVLDSARVTATVVEGADTVFAHALGVELGVRLGATRDTIRYGPSGRGFGASNTTVIVRKGGAADTIVVSRLGRVRGG